MKKSLILQNSISRSTLTSQQKLDAIAWAAKHTGVSYGRYTLTASSEEIEYAYFCFAQFLECRRQNELSRCEKMKVPEKKRRK